ncbi:MAG: hypothetical protein QOI24_3245 [Acidobacteriota bacterium]|jgi:cell division protein FtsI/penicillin-binding protein 2|nr:hypothetical protein [Acidobacteriota bacterium]
MWIAIGLLLPVSIFMVLGIRFRERRGRLPQWFSQAAAMLAALWCCVAMALLVGGSGRWPRTTQIAWSGISQRASAGGAPLAIGGSQQDAVTGWPNASFDPLLRITPAGPDRVSLTIARGGAFVIDRATRAILNGLEIPEDRSRVIDGYRFEMPVDWWLIPEFVRRLALVPYRLRVVDTATGAVVSDVRISRPGPLEKYRYTALESLTGRSRKTVVQNTVYENWSRPVLLVATRSGVRILDRTSTASHDCALPCGLTLKWRRLTLNTQIVAGDGGLGVRFERPWRRVSPLPEKVDGVRQLVVTREARPGDYAFLLPLGGGIEDPRMMLRLSEDDGVGRFANARATASAPVGGKRDSGVVTSETDVRAGDYSFHFATAIDIIHPTVVVIRLLLSFVVFAIVIFVVGRRIHERNRWLAYGVALVLFAILSFRVALAVRYAAAPEFIDQIAIKGVVLSLVALTAGPAMLLLEAQLRQDASIRIPNRREATTAMRLTLGCVAVVILATLSQLRVASSIWPELPAALLPSTGINVAILVLLAILGGHFLFAARRAYMTQRQIRRSFTYEHFAERSAQFWRSVGEPRSKSSWKWLVTFALVFAGSLSLLRFLPGTRLIQEVMAPLVITLLAAILWLGAARAASQRTSERRWSGARWRWMAVCAIVTVAVPVFLAPLLIGDPGSMLATLAVFVPVTIVLLVADRGGRPGIIVFICLFLALGGAFALYMNWEELYPTLDTLHAAGNVPARLLVFKRAGGVQEDILRTSQALEEAYQHTWENRAIAHEGRWLGLGYGHAPTRRSHVTQDTLQFDSVFSFFVVSEHGVIGGASLMLLYAMPLLFFLFSSIDVGLSRAIGLVISFAFFAEAWFHAAMNVGAWPFAGRNLPLLSINSGTDALKWFCFFLIAISAPFWRSEMAQEAGDVVVSSSRVNVLRIVAGTAAALLVLVIGVTGIRIVLDERLGEPLTWTPILKTVDDLSRNGKLTLDAQNKLVLAPDEALENSLLVRQIAAFNQLPLEEQTGTSESSQFAGKLFGVTDLASYDRVLREEGRLQLDRPRPRPPLFRLVPMPEYADEDGLIPIVGGRYRIEPNAEFNARISFRPAEGRDSFPKLLLSEQETGTYVLQGGSFRVMVPRRAPRPFEDRHVLLDIVDGDLSVIQDDNPTSPRGEVSIRLDGKRGSVDKAYVRFDVSADGRLYLDNHPRGFHLRIRRGPNEYRVVPGQRAQLVAGDRVFLPVQISVDPSFTVGELEPAPIVGPAWVMGRWASAYDRSSPLPWTPYVVTALEREWERLGPTAAATKYRVLTIDPLLQQKSQDLAAQKGRELHAQRIAALGAFRARMGRKISARELRAAAAEAQPPRVAMSMISIPDGRVLAMAGWPRMAAGPIGGPCTAFDSWCPPSAWIDRSAPSFVRSRYGSDRNFDRIEMGSSTKPLLAAAALVVHPGLHQQLRVRGPAGEERDVFGIELPGRTGWQVLHDTPQWEGFDEYLAHSDNRYQVRLGFLALADRYGGDVLPDGGASPSDREALGVATPWGRYPHFPNDMKFSSRARDRMQRIDDSLFAQAIRDMYAVGVRQGDFRGRRYSFWSGDGSDDLPREIPVDPNAPKGPEPMSTAFDSISPEIANLAFDYLTAPRQYVSFLLGGYENRWSNVDFAGAFASAVTGHVVTPHVLVQREATKPLPGRRASPVIAAALRPGLQGVITGGTATFARQSLLPLAITSIPGVKAYAKTGTLAVANQSSTTSRLVIAFIRWEDEARGIARKGVVLSFVAQNAEQGYATRCLAEFIRDNQTKIAEYLQ